MQITSLFSKIKSQAAFTMIELLIVIAILGILAVAVLAAINPIEQINRGRDTGSRSDAEQALSAIDRYYAYKGYYPWVQNPNATSTLAWRGVSGATAISYDDNGTPATIDAWMDATTGGCAVLDKVANGDGDTCEGTNEVKRSFVDKITKSDYNHLYVYYNGQPGSSLYVCFKPQSGVMQEEASDRCSGTTGAGLPADLQAAAASVCADGEEYVCLP